MRVISVTLERFGALRGRFQLDPGLTVIAGPNESGKSTLHTALRVALCGVELPGRGRMPKETEELLRRYRPWRGESFRLETEVELGGSQYRLVRDLSHPDQAQVFDLVRGGDVTSQFRRGRQVDASVGLGMSREAYLAVSSVAQDQILEISGSSLQEDLQRATSTSGADTTARAAIDLLSGWRQKNLRSESSRKRPMDEVRTKVDELRGQLERAREERGRLSQGLGEQEQLRAELTQAETACREAELLWKTAELRELDSDLLAIEELDSQLATPVPPLPDQPEQIREHALGAVELGEQLRQARAQVEELSPKDQQRVKMASEVSVPELDFLARALDQKVPPLPAQAGGTGRLELLDRRQVGLLRWTSDLLAVVGVLGGLALIFKGASMPVGSSPLPYFLAGLLVLVLLLGAFLLLQARMRGLLALAGFSSIAGMQRAARAGDPEVLKAIAAQEEVLSQRSRARQRLQELGLPEADSHALRAIAQDLPQIQVSLQEAASWQSQAMRLSEDLLQRGQGCGIRSKDPLQVAEQLGQMMRQLEAAEADRQARVELLRRREERLSDRELRQLIKRAEELRFELGPLDRGSPEPGQVNQLRQAYDAARSRRDQVRDQLLPLEGGLRHQLREVGDVVDLEELLASRTQELERMAQAEAAVLLAISELEQAEGQIHNSLAPLLADGLSRRLPRITRRRYQRAWVDPADLSMHVAASASGRQIPVESLSQGTQEQIYVCLRMVLAQALSPKGEQLPLIFDDPSVNSDDRRCFALLDTLLELSQTSQVVIFSHETRVAAWAQRRRAPMLLLQEVPVSADPVVALAEEAL